MGKEVSRNTLAVLVVLAVIFSVATTWATLSKVSMSSSGGPDELAASQQVPNLASGVVTLTVLPKPVVITGEVTVEVTDKKSKNRNWRFKK